MKCRTPPGPRLFGRMVSAQKSVTTLPSPPFRRPTELLLAIQQPSSHAGIHLTIRQLSCPASKTTATITIIDQTLVMTKTQTRITMKTRKEQLVAMLAPRIIKMNREIWIHQINPKFQILEAMETKWVTDWSTKEAPRSANAPDTGQ